ncbi:hypothetical protein N7D90_24490 (plasmid) [Pseudomonas fragi]|uniref:hypothetical protein n=1 Tax=Pseudomonas fragi TaxID=296 RepID=UPI0021C15D3B|nr:hypothetical protein [Pseudomonas fragi]UXL41021.1 hypothetical protein N7D90_24490 [Pseudomonas fragi]
MKFVSFSACTGWYWISSGGKTAMPVAGWAVTDTGDVVGMIVSNATSVQGTYSTPALSPPGGIGSYVQEQQLNETARATLKRPSM